jgi:hypothetical protein
LAAYAEAWISGAKVVVFGDATSPLAQRLVERGARHVQVFDVDAARAAEATAASSTKHVSFTPLDMAGSALRDGLYDVGIIEDLALARRNPKELLTPLVRALSKRGLALIGSRNPDINERLISCAIEAEQPLGYYDFYETVSQHFEEVRMLGQTPFVGYAIADFSAADASEVRLDTALLPGGAEEPEWFLALASALPVSPDAFSVIQLPLAELELGATTAATPSDAAARARAEQAEARVATLDAELKKLLAERARDAERREADKRETDKLAQKLESVEGELRRASVERTRETERSREAERRDAERRVAERRDGERVRAQRSEALESELRKRIEGLELELRKRDEWLAGLESRAATADQRADDVQAELDRLTSTQRKGREQVGRLEQQLEDERRGKQKLEESTRALEQELERRKRRGDADAQRSAELAQENKALTARVEQLTSALADSEQRAKSATARVEQLTSALAESERAAKKLALEGDEEARIERAELDALLKERASEVARLEAALHDTERFGRQLIVQVRELGAAREVPPLNPDVQALVQRNAELAADLEAARWTISSLEANVGSGPTGSPAGGVPRRDELSPTVPQSVPGADS